MTTPYKRLNWCKQHNLPWEYHDEIESLWRRIMVGLLEDYSYDIAYGKASTMISKYEEYLRKKANDP